MAHDEIDDFLIESRLVLQFRNVERVGQAADVQHEVGFRRDAELEAEGHDCQAHGVLGPAVRVEQVADPLFVLGGGEQTGIDGIIGPLLEGLQDSTLLPEGLPGGEALGDADGVAAARLAVAAHQHLVRRVEEEDLILYPLLVHLVQRVLDFLRRAAAADVHAEGHPLELVVARFREGRDAGQQRRRDVIDAEKADVLQRIHGDGFSSARKAADDQ